MFLNIIIATRNRCHLLPRALKSILEQKVSGVFGFDILVVDNNSTDQTRQVVESLMPSYRDKLRYIVEPKKGKSFAVNRGIKESKGDILVFTDDDVVADGFWLESIAGCFREYGCDGVGGRILAEYPPHAPAWIRENADLLVGPILLYDYGEGIKPYARPMYEFFGANFAFKRALFDECGYIRTDIGPGQGTMGDDTELVSKFLRAGKKLYYCGKALVWHPVEDQRMNLKYISAWNVALGRYRFLNDEQGKIDPSWVCYFGMPRFLLAQMTRNSLGLLTNIFDRRQFLAALIDFCRDWGRALEIRKAYCKERS